MLPVSSCFRVDTVDDLCPQDKSSRMIPSNPSRAHHGSRYPILLGIDCPVVIRQSLESAQKVMMLITCSYMNGYGRHQQTDFCLYGGVNFLFWKPCTTSKWRRLSSAKRLGYMKAEHKRLRRGSIRTTSWKPRGQIGCPSPVYIC